ncbi:MAG: hypothetical protein ABSB32_00350 [Thermodesulfobacteriota bacterium]
MSKSKIVAMMALIAFAMGIFLVGDAAAGEKFKGRTVWYTIKWEPINAPGEEKHLLAVADSKGINSNTEGKAFGEGAVERSVGVYDVDIKTESGFQHGYMESTDRDGDKIYYRWEARRIKGKLWGSEYEGQSTILRGTGKYEGIQGKGTYSLYLIAPMQSYTDWEMEVELPR